MCNGYYPIDELIDIQYDSYSLKDIRESMLIRMNQLKIVMKEPFHSHILTDEEFEKMEKENEEYAKECRESSKVSDATLNRRFTI